MEIIDIKDSIVSEQIKASIDEMVNAYCDELIKQDKEIERLNNRINELEKHINSMCFGTIQEEEIIDNILNKLKGGNENEMVEITKK